jgi:serine/threonine protein kinase
MAQRHLAIILKYRYLAVGKYRGNGMAEEAGTKSRGASGQQYYLMEKISQGGMAEIFKGLSYDVDGIKKTVCIKKILPHIAASKEFIDSLIDEAKTAVKLVHGNIAQTYDLGKVGEDYFMVMEYVDGKSLSQIHKRCEARGELIPIQFLTYFISEVLSGLDYIHRRTDESGSPLGIVHRDMSPQNIMVSFSGTVKIIDFGIAKSGFRVGATDAGILKGKFAYMSPEQAYGDLIDNRSDIFSVGIMFHEMLSGRRLFKGQDSRETIRNVRRAKVEPPSSARPDVPDELDRIVTKALSKDRRRRYALASEMQSDLVKFLHTTYPDFKPSDAAQFMQDLFKAEMQSSKRMEADARTPYLIIDKTNSALVDDAQFEITGAMKAPVDLSEFMVEGDVGERDDEEFESERRGHGEPEEKTQRKPPMFGLGRMDKKKMRLIQLVSISILIASLAAIGVIKVIKKPTAPVAGGGLAELMVITNPSDAEVLLDGTVQGKGSPISIRNISAGADHTLLVRKDGFLDHQRTLAFKPGEFTSLSIALTPAAPTAASLELVTRPAGATIFIDDRETLQTTPATIGGMDAGKSYGVGLYLKGYRFWRKDVELKPGENKSFDIELEKDFGSALIDSDPKGALILIDGTPKGQTPTTLDELEPDRVYKVEIWLDGYDPQSKEFKATAGKTEEIRMTLQKTPIVPEEKAKPEATDDSETGQKAKE